MRTSSSTALLALLLACGTAQALESPAIPDVYAVKSPAADLRGTAAQPLIIGKLPDDPAHAANERDLTSATKILALFTFALWIANIWLIIETKRASSIQARATQNAIGEAKRSADAMRDVATATKENAALMSGMLSKQMRAYIQVNIGKSTAQREEGIVFGSWPEIVNVGLTPAKRVSYRIMADILDPRFGNEFVYPEPEKVSTNDATLNPRGTFQILAAARHRFDPTEVEEISKGETKRLFVWGTVTYDDIFDGRHETRFSHNFIFFDRTDPETGRVEHKVNSYYSTGHNDAT